MVRTIRAFKKELPLEATTPLFGLLTTRKHPTRCLNISPDDQEGRLVAQRVARKV
jgi:hypothetical protein